MSEGYRYVEGVFGGQAICLETSQMHVSKTEIQSAVFYGKPNDAETFYHFVVSKGEGYINGESTISVSVFGLAGEEVFLQDWHNEIATLVSDAIIFNPGFTIDELLVFDRIVTPEEVQQWSEQTQPFIDQSEIDYQFTLIQQTEEKIALVAEDIQDVKTDMSKLEIKATGIESTVSTMQQHSSIAKPEDGKLWHFDISLNNTEGEEPLTSENVELNDKGKFGGSVKLMQGSSLVYDIPPSSSLTIGMYIKKGEW